MAKLEYFIVSEGAAIDKNTNAVSIFNVLEELKGIAFPYVVPTLTSLCALNMDEKEIGRDFQISTFAYRPDGKVSFSVRHNFTCENRRHRIRLGIGSATFDQVGDWVLEVKLNDDHLATHTIHISEPDPDMFSGKKFLKMDSPEQEAS